MEEWRPVEGYDERYEISSLGRVRAYSAYHKSTRILKPGLCGSNPEARYMFVAFFNHKNHYIHRLVARAFIPNPENKPQVNHKDGCKTNNCVDNLEWNTRSENMTHSVRLLGNSPPSMSGENNPKAVLTQTQADEIRTELSKGVSGRSLAKKYNTTDTVISKIKLGKTYLPIFASA
jgi:hypothetical protein